MRVQIDDGHTRGNGVANIIVRVLLPSQFVVCVQAAG